MPTLPQSVRATLHGLGLSLAAGLALGFLTGPPVIYFTIPVMLNTMGLFGGTFLLLIAAGLIASKSYAADWTAALSALEACPPQWLNRAVWAAAGLVGAGIGILKLCQYNSFQAHTDLAIFTNVCWQTLHGHLLRDGVKGLDSYLGDHFSPVLILFSPLLWIWKNALILQMAQSFLLALSIPALYELAKSYTHSAALAVALPITLLVNPYFHRTASAYFEPSTLAVPALLWAFVFWRSDRKILAGALALSVLTFKEEAPFSLVGLGIYLMAKGRKKQGLGLILTAIFSFILITQVIIPQHLPLPVKSRHLYLLGSFGSSYSQIIFTILENPLRFLAALVWPPGKLITPFWLIFSVGFLPLAAPFSLIPPAISLLPHQMAGYGPFGYQALSVHYASFPLALALWSACAGLGRAGRWLHDRQISALAVTCVVTASGLLVPSPYVEIIPLSQKRIEAANDILGRIPPEASVWAPSYFVAHLACRERIKTLTDREYLHRDWFEPDCMILDGKSWPSLPEGTKKDILRVFKTTQYKKVAENEGVVLLQKQ